MKKAKLLINIEYLNKIKKRSISKIPFDLTKETMQNAKLNSNIERGSCRAALASLRDLLYLSCAYFIIASRAIPNKPVEILGIVYNVNDL